MVSMKDISVACGVSVATVSKALNNHNDISEETKKNIKQVAKEMGYFPNSSARTLKTNRSYNLGVLFVDASQSGLTHDYFARVLDSFKVVAEEKGYDITFINCSKSKNNKMSYLEHSKYRGLDGVVVACVDFDDEEVLELINSDLPVVTIDHVFNNRICVMSDNIKGMRDIVTYAYKLGHRRIAFIHGSDSEVTRNRLASFYMAMEEYDLDVNDEYIMESEYRNPRLAGEMTDKLLQLKEPPTCILYPDDFSAIGGMNVIKTKGMNIPEDVSIVGYDGITIASQLDPKLTTVRQDTENLGGVAAKKLISLIEKPKSTPIEQIIIKANMVTGSSIKKII